MIIGFIIYGLLWLLKWALISWIYPFFNWKGFCKIGFHKYRKKYLSSDTYICRVCGKQIETEI